MSRFGTAKIDSRSEVAYGRHLGEVSCEHSTFSHKAFDRARYWGDSVHVALH